MLFTSYSFFILHFITLICYWTTRKTEVRQLILLLGSIVFYSWSYWPALIVFLTLLMLNYFAGLIIAKGRSRKVLFIFVALNLSVLAFFKYSNFLLILGSDIVSVLGYQLQTPEYSYWLPIGLSFYTFQMIAYLVDVYRGDIKAEESLLSFAVFKSFYAQLVAGPIVRARELLPQINQLGLLRLQIQDFHLGLYWIIAGIFLKVAIADSLGQFVDSAFSNAQSLTPGHAYLGLLGFSIQILSDFWAYSTIAIGVGLQYGIKLPYNFKNPYAAASLGEFWRTWHISLSTWLRDYLYFPLGGGRNKRYRNILITLTLAGLWHGASWNFIIYGFLHGVWLSVEKLSKSRDFSFNLPRLLKQAFVLSGVSLLRVLFKSEDLSHAVVYLKSLFGFSTFEMLVPKELPLLILVSLFLIYCVRSHSEVESFWIGASVNSLSSL